MYSVYSAYMPFTEYCLPEMHPFLIHTTNMSPFHILALFRPPFFTYIDYLFNFSYFCPSVPYSIFNSCQTDIFLLPPVCPYALINSISSTIDLPHAIPVILVESPFSTNILTSPFSLLFMPVSPYTPTIL